MVREGPPEVALLAIDLGLRFGWATFTADGTLVAYGSRHFGSRAVLKKAVRAILAQHPRLRTLAIEGGGELAPPWEREAARIGVRVVKVMGETWREELIPPRDRRTGRDAKTAADGLARDVIEKSGAKRPTSLRHDAAEAILVGTWATTAASRPGRRRSSGSRSRTSRP